MGWVWIFPGAIHCALCILVGHRLAPEINLGVTMGICQGTQEDFKHPQERGKFKTF